MSQRSVPREKGRGMMGKALAVIGVLFSVLYLLNFTVGVFELPDNLPIVGNLDEVVMSGVLLACLRYLGIEVLPFGREQKRPPDIEVEADRPAQ